ncbi:metal-sulfur cluster assembly factor [Variovorax sp. EBFNA2]|uniref:metal-sulfur cluster assembly factor n=1 Tax=Variovorax sp. EBFNA2 TaxID=3342097 RepID=UPI0029C07A69|nr:metal-sulfur cluster assembly factor [Variovorax boronicumulans]WPG40971.1 metal-sulfur cluster assembly factor [Variovorax boronicumulans]
MSTARGPDGAAPDPLPPSPFPYEGPAALREPIVAALSRVVDPEVSMSIVDVGLVYGVTVDDGAVHLRITMTSAACPVAELIVDDAELELDKVVPPDLQIRAELVWEPPWTADRMSAKAKWIMGW